MEPREPIPIRISVRDFVEFILRSGDLDSRSSLRDLDAMQEGARLHRKIQKRQGSFYRSEVSLSMTVQASWEELSFSLTVEGRADGILTLGALETRSQVENTALTFSDVPAAIDEIKCVLRDLSGISEPAPVHLAQAKCYAYFYARQNNLEQIAVQMTYCSLETEQLRYFTEFYSTKELEVWFYALCREYCKWAYWETRHAAQRNASIQAMSFPFSYRPGQKALAATVYRTISEGKRLFVEAPTGVGKTISTIYPTIKAMGEGITSKLFYLTAKTITRTVAEDTFRLLMEQDLAFLPLTITAKEKVCVLEKPSCNPLDCPRAKGHFDRINDCLYAMLSSGGMFTREKLLSYAEEYQVCPFEMSLDLALFSDAVICDYNYAFDPNVFLRRFFSADGGDYVFLIDEAHNLVDRAREMYSAVLEERKITAAKKAAATLPKNKALLRQLDAVEKKILALNILCKGLTTLSDIDGLCLSLLRLLSSIETLLPEIRQVPPEELLQLYFDVRHFLSMHDIFDDHFLVYGNISENGDFFVRIQCMDPSRPLRACLDKGRAGVFFSATLLPIRYYMEQFGAEEDDYAIYAPSPFPAKNRKILIAPEINTRYSHRNEAQFQKIHDYIRCFCGAQTGNYLIFFPSYQMLSQMLPYFALLPWEIQIQKAGMTEEEREAFLSGFETAGNVTRLGLCVMGGIFSEGIDLRGERLIGAVIVGPGLPMFCPERDLFRSYYDTRCQNGFAYAYLFPGMNKVLQSAGRVIRTMQDRGAVLLLDDRFATPAYRELFPREWTPNETVTLSSLPRLLADFWSYPASEDAL